MDRLNFEFEKTRFTFDWTNWVGIHTHAHTLLANKDILHHNSKKWMTPIIVANSILLEPSLMLLFLPGQFSLPFIFKQIWSKVHHQSIDLIYPNVYLFFLPTCVFCLLFGKDPLLNCIAFTYSDWKFFKSRKSRIKWSISNRWF